jgi:hypothetical protein
MKAQNLATFAHEDLAPFSGADYALIAAISGRTPIMLITLVML